MTPRTEADWTVELAPAAEAPADARESGMPWLARAPASVGFCDEGIVTPSCEGILASLGDAGSAAGEELRLLALRLHDIRRERGISCIALTSAMPGEGKSTVALGLAGALAREPGRRVLLVDADLRRPSLSATLGLPPARGLAEWLDGSLEHVPVRLVGSAGFFLLGAGAGGLDRPQLPSAPRMDALLRAARGLFHFVLVDAMPLLPVADSLLVRDFVDGFLIVVRSRQTRRDAAREALARLPPGRVIGTVLNDHEDDRGPIRTSAYGRYGTGPAAPPPQGRSGGR